MTKFFDFIKSLFQVSLIPGAFWLFWMGYQLTSQPGKEAMIGLTYGMGVISLIFGFLSRFKTFKGFGVEAETWSNTQEEAKALIEELRGFSVLVAEQTMTIASRIGLWGSAYTRQELLVLHDLLEKELIRNKMTKGELDRVAEPFHWRVVLTLVHPIRSEILKAIQAVVKERQDVVDAIGSPVPANKLEEYNVWARMVIDASEAVEEIKKMRFEQSDYKKAHNRLKAFLETCSVLSPEQKTSLGNALYQEFLDLDEYCRNHTFRRKEKWLVENY